MKQRGVVVGVDGSAAAEAAVLWTADELARGGGELVVVHAWGAEVVGVDGSAAAEAAVLWTADELARGGGELVVVHAWGAEPEAACYAAGGHRTDPVDGFSQACQVVERALALARERHPTLEIGSSLVRGRATPVLLRAAAGADLLVLGSSAHRAGDGRLGTVLLACLRWPPCPVVVVQPEAVTPLGMATPVREASHEPPAL
ncbi:universal stress protein [Thermoactinospora rubra]|uniref:universal stress protein n=1 Tax=Thermoactinospora rubra TaxID=1088767 RepID=UPI001301A2C3|nr:universal stress protein [Thermoactinospora rubra]